MESCKGPLRQRFKPTKRNDKRSACTQGKNAIYTFISRCFCYVLNIPPHENDTVDEPGGSTTDVNSESPIYEQRINSKQNAQSHSGSWTGGKINGRKKVKHSITTAAYNDGSSYCRIPLYLPCKLPPCSSAYVTWQQVLNNDICKNGKNVEGGLFQLRASICLSARQSFGESFFRALLHVRKLLILTEPLFRS